MNNTGQASLKPAALQDVIDYRYWHVEDYLIKFLIEKAVAMREVPFMKATEALEFSANLAKV